MKRRTRKQPSDRISAADATNPESIECAVIESQESHLSLFAVDTPPMVCLQEWPSDADVSGAFVKLSPTVRREDRDSVDLAAAVAELRSRGALAVVSAPVVTVAMGKRDVRKPRAVIDVRTRVRTWLSRNLALSDADRDLVLEYLDAPLSAEGL